MLGWRTSKSVSGAAIQVSLARIQCHRLSESVQLSSGNGEGGRLAECELVCEGCTEQARALDNWPAGFLVGLACLQVTLEGGMFSCSCSVATIADAEGMGRYSWQWWACLLGLMEAGKFSLQERTSAFASPASKGCISQVLRCCCREKKRQEKDPSITFAKVWNVRYLKILFINTARRELLGGQNILSITTVNRVQCMIRIHYVVTATYHSPFHNRYQNR